MLTVSKPKRRRGRPTKDRQTASISGRVEVAVHQAIQDIASLNRRSVSTEIGMAAEDIVLSYEQQLRAAGKWTDDLERLKQERQPRNRLPEFGKYRGRPEPLDGRE